MKHFTAIAAACMAACISATAIAQPASTAPDPAKLALARQVVDSAGGAEAMQAQIKAMSASISALAKSSLPQDARGLSDSLVTYVFDEQVKAIPSLLDDTAAVYAAHLSESEMRDMIAWNTSASGRSIREKMPAVMQDLMIRQQPRMKALMAGIMKHAIDRTCAEKHCTPAEMQSLTAVMAKVAPGA